VMVSPSVTPSTLPEKNWAKRSDGIAVKSEIINALIMFIQYYLKKRFQ
jgi:hypothetical protein